MSQIQKWDESVVLWVREYISCPFLDVIMKWISFLGDNGIVWISITILFLFFAKTQQKKWRTWGMILGSSLLISSFITNIILKPFVARLRPYDVLLLDIILPPLSDYSFPSGHTTVAFTGAVVLWHINHIFGVGAFLFAVMIAFSRIYLAVHYITDVLAGAMIGSLCAFAVIAVVRRKHLLP